MVVGFVNAGIMSLTQVVGIIIGANIGTTTTSWLVSSVEWASFLKPDTLGAVFTAIGAVILMFGKQKSIRNAGEIIVGFGVLFIGLTMMPEAVKPLREFEGFSHLFVFIGTNPLLGILVGAIITGIIQSSTASIGILQSLAYFGLIPWGAGVFIIMGNNIGSCLTAVISGMGASKKARATAFIHFLYNLAAVIIFSVPLFIFFAFINRTVGSGAMSSTQMSLFHTVYNIGAAVLLFPFANLFVKFASKMTGVDKEAEAAEDEGKPLHLDDRVLATPTVAMESSLLEINRLADMAYDNVELAIKVFLEANNSVISDTDNKSRKTKSVTDEIHKREETITKLDNAVTVYLAKVMDKSMNMNQNTMVISYFNILTDIERIADIGKGIAGLTDIVREENLSFSDSAVNDLTKMSEIAMSCYKDVITVLKGHRKELAEKAIIETDDLYEMKNEFHAEHLNRVATGVFNFRSEVIFLDMLHNLERIVD